MESHLDPVTVYQPDNLGQVTSLQPRFIFKMGIIEGCLSEASCEDPMI